MAIYDINGKIISQDNSAAVPNLCDIPIVSITTDGEPPKTKEAGSVTGRLYFKGADVDFDCYIDMKVQGSSSVSYPKKNYTIKLYTDSGNTKKYKPQFRDWKAQSKYVLKANWIDHSHARNIVNARLWAQIVRSRADFGSLPEQLRKSQLAVDGFPIKVYFNGVYQGLYTWNLPKSALHGLDDSIDTNALMEGNGTTMASKFRLAADDGGWDDETHDEKPAAIATAWDRVLAFVYGSTDSDFTAHFSEYFDRQSVIDQYIFLYAACIVDNLNKNQFFYTYDAAKWYGGMYDMDGTWGNPCWLPKKSDWFDYDTAFQSGYTVCNGGGATNLFYERLGNLFAADIQTRYRALRAGVLSEDNILGEFDRFTHVIPPYLYAEDYAETTAGGAFINIPLKEENNILQIRQFVHDRLAYVDGMLLT